MRPSGRGSFDRGSVGRGSCDRGSFGRDSFGCDSCDSDPFAPAVVSKQSMVAPWPPRETEMHMPDYLLSFRAHQSFQPGKPGTSEQWQRYFNGLDGHISDLGNPIFARASTGNVGADTVLGGYTIVSADSLEHALELAAQAPVTTMGGGVEVGEITPISEETLKTTLADYNALAS